MTTPIQHAAEILWQRMSDPLERKAFPFAEAPSRMTYLAHARALAAAGLIATEQQWGVRHPELDVVLVMDDCGRPLSTQADATKHARRFVGSPRVVTRHFTPWKDPR